MRINDFEFNLRELAGSFGDFGTLLPFAIGYLAISGDNSANGLNPTGLLVMMGLANIITGIIYRLPMPIEPMKVIGAVAISQKWPSSRIYATGFATGIIWLILAFSGLIHKIAAITPRSVVRGIQVALGIMLAIEGFEMVSTGWVLGIVSIFIVIFLRQNKYAPAAIVLMVLGITVIGFRGEFPDEIDIGFTLPSITSFGLSDIWRGLVLAGFAQVALTASNAIIATSATIKQYFPGRPVSEKKLALNTGIMNTTVPFMGGMPMCHGVGGLAGQYYFGARTGGTNIMEGLIEIGLGLFLAGSIADLFAVFPESILGAMLLLVGIQLTKFAGDIKIREIPMMALTAGLSLLTNMAIGFVSAIAVYQALSRWGRGNKYISWIAGNVDK